LTRERRALGFLAAALFLVARSAPADVARDPAAPLPSHPAHTRSSLYIAVRDGTRLAIDIYRPSAAAAARDEALPVILMATPYHRVQLGAGNEIRSLESSITEGAMLAGLLKHGYIIAVLDIRGRGASFGTVYGGIPQGDQDRSDLFDVIEWLAAQPWSDGHIGMAGCSYNALTQFLAAEAMPPHLRAIAPCGMGLDLYSGARANGITQISFYKGWDELMYELDITNPAPSTDGDEGGALLQAAIAEHRISWDKGLAGMTSARLARPYRDTPPSRPEYDYGGAAHWNFFKSFGISKIPMLEYTGWRDLLPEQVLAWHRSLARLGVPQELIIGPWYHCAWYANDPTDVFAEHLRWYDYWLKGIKNGVTNTPRVRYYLQGAPRGHEWQSAQQWPLPGERPRTYFFRRGMPGPGPSRGGGVLVMTAPPRDEIKDDYIVDYTISTAEMATRWHPPSNTGADSHAGLNPIPTDRIDAKSLTYTTAPLAKSMQLTGFPSVALWVSSTAKDQDFFVYLEEIDEKGRSTLMSEGAIRASDRATRDAPFDNQGLPWHPTLKADQAQLTPGVPVKIELALYPLSNCLKKGHRIRVTVNNFDKGQWDTPESLPRPVVSVFHDSNHPSSVSLPFIVKYRDAQ
jgi:uncharacterized protein